MVLHWKNPKHKRFKKKGRGDHKSYVPKKKYRNRFWKKWRRKTQDRERMKKTRSERKEAEKYGAKLEKMRENIIIKRNCVKKGNIKWNFTELYIFD